ncbi:MAG: proline racemase family protein [Kiloniellaceae bacterium]
MRWQRRISVVDAHAEGEVGRVITGGVLDVPGKTMFEKKRYLETRDDSLRRFCLFEPRGGAAMSVNLLLPPSAPEADLGMIVMESTDYPPMSGSNAICVVTVALETGIVAMHEPETRLVLDTPAGPVPVTARCRDGKCERVTLDNVPSFLLHKGVRLDLPDVGRVSADVAYGGAFFAIVDARDFGLALKPAEARAMVELGETIKAAANARIAAVHPENPEIAGVTFTLFGGPPEAPDGRRKTAVVISPGRLDRSPCGTGTCARLATLVAKGEMGPEEKLIHESVIGTRFTAEVAATAEVGGIPAVVPRLTGRGWIFATHEFGWDPSDPFPQGFTLSDTWGPAMHPGMVPDEA